MRNWVSSTHGDTPATFTNARMKVARDIVAADARLSMVHSCPGSASIACQALLRRLSASSAKVPATGAWRASQVRRIRVNSADDNASMKERAPSCWLSASLRSSAINAASWPSPCHSRLDTTRYSGNAPSSNDWRL